MLRAGASAVRVARAGEVDEAALRQYRGWLEGGGAAGMDYMERHDDIRRDPRLLLPAARSIICLAFSYAGTERLRDQSVPMIAAYALFPDYHDWIRQAIRQSGIQMELGTEGTDWRICIDSAPIMERYWALTSGLGFIGDNGALIVPGIGNRVFLAEIITVRELKPDSPLAIDCGHCGACRRACPTGALGDDGTIDCNLCLSYLTIEHRGEWTEPIHNKAMHTRAGRNTLFGCDRCLAACPHNNPAARASKALPEPLKNIVGLSAGQILNSDDTALSTLLRGSCLKRAKTTGIRRNAMNLGNNQ